MLKLWLRMVSESGDKQIAYLSKTLSNQFRKKEVKLGTIMTLGYTRSNNNNLIIVRPIGNWVSYDVEKLDIKAMEIEDINIEDLIAL